MKSKKYRLIAAIFVVIALTHPVVGSAAEHQLGFGVHYWTTIDDLEDEGFGSIDSDGASWLLSYQYIPAGIFRIEGDLEYFANGYGGSDDAAISPLVLVIVGSGLYAGAGLGVTYSDDFDHRLSEPFFVARVGFNFVVLPKVHLDVNANYRFNAWSELNGVDTGTITLGVIARFKL